nr:hypothetical protein [Tanacetum cinerariifolium]
MTSFGYRSNPRYAIKECSSCGTLYTRDCVCSMRTVEDKILVPKPPKNYARCTRCGYLVDGPNCHGCALLRHELEENLVTHSQDFQNSSEPSNASTNIVNAPREPYQYTVNHPIFNAPNDLISQTMLNEQMTQLKSIESEGIPEHVCDVPSHDNSLPLDISKDQIEDFSESNNEVSLIDDDSFSFDDINYVEASPPDPELVSSEVMEIVIPEVGGIDDDILLTIDYDALREKLLNVNLLISKIKALNANPTPSSDCKTKSSSTSLNSLLEETNTFDNSLPEFETFCFDVEEISSGSPTTPFDISLSEYDSFMFDLSVNLFPPADRSDSYEFTDELIPFISAPEYDSFCFTVEPNSRDFTKDVVENISPTKEPQVLTVLPTHPTLQLNLKFQPSSESLFAYVVWIFLPFLVYSVVPPYLLSLRNKDIIFDPGICKPTFSKPDISHRCGTVKKFNTHRSHLNTCPMLIHGQNNPPLDVLLLKKDQEKDKIRSKPNKNGKRGEAKKSLKQLQSIEEEKPNKTQKEWPKMQTQ